MNAHLPKITAAMNNARSPEFKKAPTSEENIEPRQFGGPAKQGLAVESGERAHIERQSDDKNKIAIDRCMRTGEVMKVLFPEGLQLKSEQEFAIFRLFDGLVGNLAQFAQTGMTQQASLRAIALHATLLEDVISSSDKR
ncbi:MAG: hypothetical protein M3453_07325 [Pseudomonadota bacterium]|nr:hypothetical protein [Pseudomonadota bacterium]